MFYITALEIDIYRLVEQKRTKADVSLRLWEDDMNFLVKMAISAPCFKRHFKLENCLAFKSWFKLGSVQMLVAGKPGNWVSAGYDMKM